MASRVYTLFSHSAQWKHFDHLPVHGACGREKKETVLSHRMTYLQNRNSYLGKEEALIN